MIEGIIQQLIDILLKQITPISAILIIIIIGLLYALHRMWKTITHKDELLEQCYQDVKNNVISLSDLCDQLQNIILTRK